MLKKLILFGIISFLLACNKREETSAKYVVLSPEVAEIIAHLEGTENISGVTMECDYPPALQTKPKVGTFGQIDIEKLVVLDPDLVFISGLEQNAINEKIQKLGIKTISVYPQSIEGFLDSIIKIGAAINQIDRAQDVVDNLKLELESLEINEEKKPRVYVEIYNDPIMSVSDSSFVGELIQLAGGNNIFAELPRDYSRVKVEDIIEKNPEVIILTCPPEITADNIKNRKGWEVISAVKNDRIYSALDIDPDLIVRASPRIIEGLKKLQKIILEDKK